MVLGKLFTYIIGISMYLPPGRLKDRLSAPSVSLLCCLVLPGSPDVDRPECGPDKQPQGSRRGYLGYRDWYSGLDTS